ncbi:hypothetical protein FE257_003212 [Aspergillus nanangensis]|uniref:Fungal STAND N-terminal Goodbye domain-containing protein n=1 Tax=Aspergillus nanangensis TaxID=2582783 RepID=A0AAD4GWD3_ASPNN|nr:hypothetical protein FE257_003212 [Aspergillus nanangensis]
MTISPISTRSPSLDLKTSAIKDEIATIWAQVQARVIQLAGGDPAKVQHSLSINTVLGYLNTAQEAAIPKESPIRTTFNTTLQLIDTVGSVVAGGAAEVRDNKLIDEPWHEQFEVFGPAELCFNALSFVIQAWQGYQGVFESLAGLLEKCSHYLGRLDYYISGGMDAKLAKVACQHLQLFVEICDRTIKLRQSKRRKLIVFSKVFFLNDNDIQDLLDKMDSLVDQEGRLVTAQIFSFASEAAVGTRENLAITRAVNTKIDMLIANKSDQIKDTDVKRRRETVLRTLAFDENKLDRNRQEPDPFWQRTYHNFRKWVIPETGQWAFSDPLFVAWENGSRDSPPILVIEGVEGSGKSYLTSTIIRKLRNRNSDESSGSRKLLAFYFLEDDSKEELSKTNNLDVIIKSLVWQFVRDASYLKSAASICEKNIDIDPHEIPEQLLFSSELQEAVNASFIIVIDGIGDIIGDALVHFLEKVSALTRDNRRVRILLTGRPRAFEQLATVKYVSFEKIAISTKNRPDVEKYIQSRMDRVEALKDTTRIGVTDLRQKISTSLCDKTAGDFFRINTILKHISTLDYVHDIDQVLEDAGKERSEQILGEIDKLNRIRSSKEIAEINEIILWVLYGREWFQSRQMAAVLYEKTGELSLLPLETKLQVKYSLFEIDSDGDIDFRSYEIPQLIPERNSSAHDATLELETGRSIHPKEVSIIKHFLTTVCPPELYNKFEFESFFEQKLLHKGDQICRDDKDTAEAKLAITCLRILTEDRDERQDLLRPYAMTYFLQHLSSVDLSLVGREWKGTVGPRLLKLFTDETSMDALLWTTEIDEAFTLALKAGSAWINNDGGVNEILRWFKDSAVMSSIPDGDNRDWITSVTSAATPGKALLEPFAKRMSEHWLREPSPQELAYNAFSLVFGYMQMLNTGDEDSDTLIPLEPTIKNICKAEELSHTLLGVKENDSLWEVQVAVIFQQYYIPAESEKRCRRALEIDPSNWRASYYLACVVTSDEEAINILKTITDRLQADTQWMENGANQMSLSSMLFDMGERHWEIDQYDAAKESYTRSVETNITASERILKILERYNSRKQWSDIMSLLETIQTHTDDSHYLSRLLVTLAAEDSVHSILLQAVVETQQTDFLQRIYDAAIRQAIDTESYNSLYYLRYHFANTLFQRTENEERAVALWELALKEDLPRSMLDVEDLLPSLTLKLAAVYLRRAREAARDSDVARSYLQRISEILPDEVAESNILSPAKLYLARYYQVQGEGVKAKQIARSVVKMALEILSDDDSDNDYLAYWRLLLVFLPLNDNENAYSALVMAALATRMLARSTVSREVTEVESPVALHAGDDEDKEEDNPNLGGSSGCEEDDDDDDDDGQATESSEPETLRPLINESQAFAICDGECGYCWETASEMWWCKDCINITFEKNCFQLLQQGTLPLNVCDKRHEFLQFPKWEDEKMRQLPKGFVPYGEKAIPLEEWKRIISKNYVDFDG